MAIGRAARTHLVDGLPLWWRATMVCLCRAGANGVYCGRRVAKLYAGGRLFACRHCYRLCYNVQRIGQWIRRTTTLRVCTVSLALIMMGQRCPPPPKPKWMRWKTYLYLVQQIEAGEARLDFVFTIGAQHILARLERSGRPPEETTMNTMPTPG